MRDIRQQTIQAIIEQRPFSSVTDLLLRVTLQKKELLHLIQCGALDGLAANRAVLLSDAERQFEGYQAGQMPLAFGDEALARPAAGQLRIEPPTAHIRAVFPKSRSRAMQKPKTWQPVILTGQWRCDRFGNHAFVVAQLS